jgi:hypothetical protein
MVVIALLASAASTGRSPAVAAGRRLAQVSMSPSPHATPNPMDLRGQPGTVATVRPSPDAAIRQDTPAKTGLGNAERDTMGGAERGPGTEGKKGVGQP